MLDKKIDKLIDNITPDLLNLGENVPTDYNDLYKIISNVTQIIKATYQAIPNDHENKKKESLWIKLFVILCDTNDIYPCVLENDKNIVLVRSIVQEIIK